MLQSGLQEQIAGFPEGKPEFQNKPYSSSNHSQPKSVRNRARVTPVPIPNTEVKTCIANGTRFFGARESRTRTGLGCEALRAPERGPFLFCSCFPKESAEYSKGLTRSLSAWPALTPSMGAQALRHPSRTRLAKIDANGTPSTETLRVTVFGGRGDRRVCGQTRRSLPSESRTRPNLR